MKKKSYLVLFFLLILLVISGYMFFCLTEEKEIVLSRSEVDVDSSLEGMLNKVHSVRKYADSPLTLKEIAQILWAAGGERVDAVTGATRTIPASHGKYKLKYYLVADKIRGLPAALYKYNSEDHSLAVIKKGNIKEKLLSAMPAKGQNYYIIKGAPAVIVFTADIGEGNRDENFYGKKTEDFIYTECGHSGQNIYLMTEEIGLGTVALFGYFQNKVKNALSLPVAEQVYYIFAVGSPKDKKFPPLDQSKWQLNKAKKNQEIELVNKKLRLAIKGRGIKLTTRVKSLDTSTNYFESLVSVGKESFVPKGMVGFARIAGVFYNDSYNSLSGRNCEGIKGDIWTMNYLEYYSDGRIMAKAVVARYDGSPGMEMLMERKFNLPISLENDYKLSIEFEGNQLIFKCIDVNSSTLAGDTIVYRIETPTHEPFQKDRELAVRIHSRDGKDHAGYLKGEFDNVRIKKDAALYENFD